VDFEVAIAILALVVWWLGSVEVRVSGEAVISELNYYVKGSVNLVCTVTVYHCCVLYFCS